MKTPVTAAAAAALLLVAGSAFAQPKPMPNMSTTAGRDSTGSPPMTTSAGASQSGTNSSDASTSGATMPATNTTTTANMPSGDAPESYPTCTKRGQDRCKSNGRRGY